MRKDNRTPRKSLTPLLWRFFCACRFGLQCLRIYDGCLRERQGIIDASLGVRVMRPRDDYAGLHPPCLHSRNGDVYGVNPMGKTCQSFLLKNAIDSV